ncbi:MAG: DNA polymerase Y family protein [Nevskia sp.]|nr:DNA polymerase Y family protein [Nevskia sp.]
MLWLCIHLPALPLEALAPPPDSCVAVAEPEGARRRLVAVSAAAAARGVQAGIDVPAALGLAPDLRLLPRNPQAEGQALETVACWAYELGAPVTLAAAAASVWVEIRRSLRLFGGWAALRRQVQRQSGALAYTVQYGVAPTLAAAALLARADAGLARPLTRRGEIHAGVANWPLQRLPLPRDVLAVLHGSGLRRIGQVLALPRDALGRRFGAQVPLLLERLLGRAAEPWESYQPPAVYRRSLELPGGVQSTEALLFPLRKMIGELVLYLRARDVAVQRFNLVMVDARRGATALEIGLLAPSRDAARLWLLVRERLEKVALPAPALELRLEAERFESAPMPQGDLFGTARHGEQLAELQERLAARLGAGAVRRLAATADHRPEQAWSTQGPAAGAPQPPRPLWLLPQVKPIPMPRLLGPPERIESGWWDGRHQARDYHLAQDAAGRKLWVYRELGSSQWHLHGLWE